MKVIIISGGNKGLGKKIKETLFKNPITKIAIISRSVEKKESQNFISFKGNITNATDIYNFLHKVYIKWKQVDVLINNAGVVNLKPFLDYTKKDYNDIFNINVRGNWLMTQSVIKLNQNNCYIINIGSTRSITGAPNKSLYSMSKASLRSMTQCINAELKSKGIYSTIVCPGSFKTVSIKEIARIVEHLIELPITCHIPEIVIGGML